MNQSVSHALGPISDFPRMDCDSVVAVTSLLDDDDTDKPPPAKRPRMDSDADQSSSFTYSATPPPASGVPSSAGTPAPPSSSEPIVADAPMLDDNKPLVENPPIISVADQTLTHSPPSVSAIVSSANTPGAPILPTSTLTAPQYKFCQSMVRSLKRLKDAVPFLKPVDYVLLNVPHYPTIIKTPMDFSTIERKLVSSNPNKLDSNSSNPRYFSVDELINDVRLIFQNCITFNGPDHSITLMGKRVEQVFDKQIKQMPQPEIKLPVKKAATPPAPQPQSQSIQIIPLAKKVPNGTRRMSNSIPVIRRSETEAVGRPKREIHPPPPKDLAYADQPKKHRKHKTSRDDGTSDQLKFCGKLLADLHRKQHYSIASPFYEPVDWVKLDLPSYPKIVKKPMDLLTIRKKLELNQYLTSQKFFNDFKLMIRNCFLFNPAGTPVNQAGIELQRVFDEKWKQLPPLRDLISEEDDGEGYDSDDERRRTIAEMESQIETMRGSIAALKNNKGHKERKKEKREKHSVVPTSKSSSKTKAPLKKKTKRAIVVDNDVLTFEQKKELSESIGGLDEGKMEKVIKIIHEGVPELRDHTEEIELDVDSLPAAVLSKLYNFVIRPTRPAANKRNRQGKGTGTGGLRRKSMDEDVEAEKIRLLEERIALFEERTNGNAIVTSGHDSDRSSESSTNSDSSGSDSE